jgi:hypothetical protein
MSGVYAEIENDLRQDIKSLKYDKGEINIAIFTRVINMYFQLMFKSIIYDNFILSLHNKLGHIYAIKSMCIRYNPTKVYFVTENGEKVRKVQKMKLKSGRWAFMFWDVGKKWRMYRFNPASKWKKQLIENFHNGADYPEMDLKEYGRTASPTYVQRIR